MPMEAYSELRSLEPCIGSLADFRVRYCVPEPTGSEIAVSTVSDAAAAEALPTAYTGCHQHGTEWFCETPSGEEIAIPALAATTETATSETEEEHEEEEEAEEGEVSCHFHAGVEHCTGGAASEAATSCTAQTRTYKLPIRIGALFIVMVTSAIAVFAPLVLSRYTQTTAGNWVMIIVKQFGTGVIVATAFVHLLTHAQLMFSSDCVGELTYEAATTAIAMAGIMVAFLVEFAGDRYIQHRAGLARTKHIHHSHGSQHDTEAADSDATTFTPEKPANAASAVPSHDNEAALHSHDFVVDDKLSVFVMEAGIIFHSILIGVTTVVAGDTVFTTLLVVIVFHQAFEGLALGARIASLVSSSSLYRICLAGAFALITPIGMAIGIAVRNEFNGNDKQTLIAMGTLDAFSAGILIWVGVVEMWCHDWLFGAMRTAGLAKTFTGLAALCAGMIAMGALGKWA